MAGQDKRPCSVTAPFKLPAVFDSERWSLQSRCLIKLCVMVCNGQDQLPTRSLPRWNAHASHRDWHAAVALQPGEHWPPISAKVPGPISANRGRGRFTDGGLGLGVSDSDGAPPIPDKSGTPECHSGDAGGPGDGGAFFIVPGQIATPGAGARPRPRPRTLANRGRDGDAVRPGRPTRAPGAGRAGKSSRTAADGGSTMKL
jgi:hypothetical protein